MPMKQEPVEILIAQNQTDFDAMMKVRRQVFVDEQKIPEHLEFDGNDFGATHVLAKVEGQVVGAMRIRYFSDFVKFERMAVLPPYRKSNITDKIMNKAFEFVAKKGYRQVYGVCKRELLHRWQKCGYFQIDDVPAFQHNGMELIPIMRVLTSDPNALTIQSHPDLLTAREDAWDKVVLPQNTILLMSTQKQSHVFDK